MKIKFYAFMNCLKRNYVKIVKTIWLILLLYICGLYIKTNYNRMITGMIHLDYIIILLSIVLVLMPLVSEIDLWGLKVKREIQRVEKELNKEIIYLHKQMMNVETNNSQSINLGYLPSLEVINTDDNKKHEIINNKVLMENKEETKDKNDSFDYKEKYEKLLKESIATRLQLESDLLDKRKDIEEAIEDKKRLFFLETRIVLHNEIQRIVSPVTGIGENTMKGLKIIEQFNLIDSKDSNIIRTIYNMCNRSVHGEIISLDYYRYAKDNLPDILEKLKKVCLPVTCT